MAHAQHTPGPWATDGYTVFRPRQADETLSTNLAHVLDIPGGYTLDMMAQRAANARLIAAAPEMLAALEFAARFIADEVEQRGLAGSDMSDYQDEAAQALECVEAAITKAKGV